MLERSHLKKERTAHVKSTDTKRCLTDELKQQFSIEKTIKFIQFEEQTEETQVPQGEINLGKARVDTVKLET